MGLGEYSNVKKYHKKELVLSSHRDWDLYKVWIRNPPYNYSEDGELGFFAGVEARREQERKEKIRRKEGTVRYYLECAVIFLSVIILSIIIFPIVVVKWVVERLYNTIRRKS